MNRFALVAVATFVFGCDDAGTDPPRVALDPGTYDIALPFGNVTSWPAPVPPEFGTSLGCVQYVNGWYIVSATGSVEAHRIFRNGPDTWEEIVTGEARRESGVQGAVIDFGVWEEHARPQTEGSESALYIDHVFRGSGTCPEQQHTARYTLR